jgi:thiol-disulfide isomerase/thioredoxin
MNSDHRLFGAIHPKATARPPIEDELASFSSATGWLNAEPLAAADLHGKVVLIGFWTYTCINWLRTLPYIRAWTEKYKNHGLVTVGVHTPEFEFEKNIGNVRSAVRDLRVDYPVAIDNRYTIWHAFKNEYWPALYLADAAGRIRHHHFGEGAYRQSEILIQQLLDEAGAGGISPGLVSVDDAVGPEAAADWDSLKSPETYLGYQRTENFASPGGLVAGQRYTYETPPRLGRNHWSLAGDWAVGDQAAVLHEVNGRIAFRFHARDLHLVMGPAARGGGVRFRVLIDGQPPGAAHGTDTDENGYGTAADQRLYQLIRQPNPVHEHTFEVTFLDAGVQAYVFTFG